MSKEDCSIAGAVVSLSFGFTANANAVSSCFDNKNDGT